MNRFFPGPLFRDDRSAEQSRLVDVFRDPQSPMRICTACYETFGHGLVCPRCRAERDVADAPDAERRVRDWADAEVELRALRQREAVSIFNLVRRLRTVGLLLVPLLFLIDRLVGARMLRRAAAKDPLCGLAILRRRQAGVARAAAREAQLVGELSGLLSKAECADPALLDEIAAGFDPAEASLPNVVAWLRMTRVD